MRYPPVKDSKMTDANPIKAARNRTLASVTWTTALALAFAFAAAFTSGAKAAPPPANSVIGNQATATYQDAGGTSRTATSNLVQTTVAQVYSHTLTASQSRIVAPGGTVYFPHTLTNTGNGTDTYTLASVDPAGGNTFSALAIYADANGDGVPDNSTAITTTGSLAANGVFRFVVAATVPGSATAGAFESVTVNSTGNVADTANSPAAAGTNTDAVVVSTNAVINVVKSLSITSGPAPSASTIRVTLTYTNTGAATASNVTFVDHIGGSGTVGSTAYNTSGMSYVAASGAWSGSGTALTDAAGGDPAGIAFDHNISTAGRVTATVASVAPGASGTVSFSINVLGSATAGIGSTSNVASYAYNDGVGAIAAAPSNVASYTVAAAVSVNATDVGSTTDGDGANDIVHIASALQGTIVQFHNVIQNTGSGTDTINITLPANTFPAGTTFALYNTTNSAPLTDSNGDGVPDTGPLAAGASTNVWVRVQLPPTATNNAAMTVTKRATSVANSATFDEVTDRLATITAKTVDLTNNAVGGLGAGFSATGEVAAQVTQTVNPGASTSFQLFISNTSTAAENYDLIATTTQAGINTATPTISLPAGWTVTFRLPGTGSCVAGATTANGAVITNTGNIAVGGNLQVCAIVTIPGGASAATTDLFFRSASPASAQFSNVAPSQYAAFDVKHDAVTVNAVANLTLVPNRSGTIFPGGNQIYSHTLANNGNTVLNGITFPALGNNNSAAGWTNVLYIDNGDGVFSTATDTPITPGTTTTNLAAGASVIIWDNVFAPLGATDGQTNTTTITAQHALGAPAGVSVTDVTTVVTGTLTVLKEQSQVDCTSGALIGGFSTAQLSNLAPGLCVKYRITATNSGSSAITTLLLSDAVPSFTTLDTTPAGCPVAAVSTDATLPAPVVGGTAADEATGSVTASKASLAPLTNVVLTFCVQIDQ